MLNGCMYCDFYQKAEWKKGTYEPTFIFLSIHLNHIIIIKGVCLFVLGVGIHYIPWAV